MPLIRSLKPSQAPGPVIQIWNNFSGGFNGDYYGYPLVLDETELSESLNWKYIKTAKGVKLRSRDGLTKITTVSALPGAVKDFFYYTTSAGSTYIMVVADSDLNRMNSGTYVKIADLSSTRGRMCQFNDKLIVADGGSLKYWNGSTFSFLSDMETPLLPDISAYASTSTGFSGQALWSPAVSKAGQAFAISNIGVLTYPVGLMGFIFYVRRVGTSATGNIICKIYNDAGTLIVTSTTSTAIGSFSTDWAWVTFNFDDADTLASSDTYYVVLEGDSTYNSSADTSNHLSVGYITSSTTSNRVVYNSGAWVAPYTTSGTMVYGTYPGQTVAGYSFAPLASFVIQKQDRIYCNHATYLNRLYYSNANDPNDWSSEDGGGYIIFDGHHKINGAFIYNKSIYVFCDNPKAIYQLTGDSPEEYVVNLIFRDVTAISQDAIQDVGNDLLFVDTRGAVSLRKLITEGEIEKAIVSSKKMKSFVAAASSQITGKCEEDNQFWSTSFSDYVIVYDVEIGEWTYFQFELGASVTPTALGVINGISYIGASDGHLYSLDYTAEQDNGVDFSLPLRLNWSDLDTLLVKSARYVDSLIISPTQTTYDLQIYKNFGLSVTKTLSMITLTQGGAYQSPFCGNINEFNINFNQISLRINNLSSAAGPHWVDRFVLEANILSDYI